MIKGLLGTIAVAALLIASPASAQTMECTDANIEGERRYGQDARRRKEDRGHEGNDHGERDDDQKRHGRVQDPHGQDDDHDEVIDQRSRGGKMKFGRAIFLAA